MSFNYYYQDELSTLRELGREFAGINPMLTPWLAAEGVDPDVERLLEGFAFLSGRLWQKLNGEVPEITHSLLRLLWSSYLRPVPSCSIVRYAPDPVNPQLVRVPRGTAVESIPVEGTPCRFRTAYEVEVMPLKLIEQTLSERGGVSFINLRFAVTAGAVRDLDLKKLRFFFSGEPGIAFSFYFTLLAKTKTVRFALRDKDNKEHVTAVLAPDRLKALGFREGESLFPAPANTFPGYRLMQEYFCFPEKFLFLEISGLEEGIRGSSPALSECTEFELQFALTHLPGQAESFRKNNIKMFCTPVVNLFHTDATPLLVDHRQFEYRIVPYPATPYHFACYSVDEISSWRHESAARYTYAPFESFEHDCGQRASQAYYYLRTRPSSHDAGTETYLSIIYPHGGATLPEPETISLELTCTNRLLPAQLAVGDIRPQASTAQDMPAFSNVTSVTPSYAPPLEDNLLWRFISNMSLNYTPLMNADSLRAVISACDFRALSDQQRARTLDKILRGIVKAESANASKVYKGLPLCGRQATLTLNQSCFSCEGEMWLFASVINEFLALYATVNSFSQLRVIEEKCGEKYQWPGRLGSTII